MDATDPGLQRDDRFGLERGKVFPAAEAAMLERRVRRLVQSPRRIVRAMRLRPTDRILELGCGPGYFSANLARAVPEGSLTLFDLQAAMLERARTKSATARPVQGDATRLPFASATFDVTFVSAVLGEVPDPAACLGEVARVLSAGGRLVVAEIRGDDDFIPLPALRSLLAPAGFSPTAHRRTPWSYVATFTAPPS